MRDSKFALSAVFTAMLLFAAGYAQATDSTVQRKEDCTTFTTTGQIGTTLNPADTTNTNASIYANPAACSTDELLMSIMVASSTKASIDCEGDLTATKGNFSGVLTASSTSTMTGAVAFGASNTYQAGDIIAADIADITRYVQLPITGWVPCTGQGIWTTDGADAAPNLTALNSGLAIVYDATGGSVDTGEICTTFIVPPNYVSGGAVVASVIGGTTTNTETFSCRVSQNGGSVGSANAANIGSAGTKENVTSTPVVTYAAGDAIALICKQGNASADDAVKILGLAWSYTSTQ